ncbi:hypothetical protein HZS_2620, partial [Henneguya salminicola]
MLETPGASSKIESFLFGHSKCSTSFIIPDLDFATIVSHLTKSLQDPNCSWKFINSNCISVSMHCIRNQNLKFRINIFCSSNGKIMVNFRLIRGDREEFKRIFQIIKEKMSQLVPFFHLHE